MFKTGAVYLAIAGAAVGAALVGLFIWTQMPDPAPAPIASVPPAESPAPATPTAPSEAPAETAMADPKGDRPKPPVEAITPSFDLLRVEPDGSTVIAGKGAPNTRLDVMSGDKVIATTEIGPSGDFAAVLDEPLAAGDYQLTLRTAGADGAAATSEEVATVSIPTDGASGLLAMVTKPGEASRILTQPEAPAATPAPEAPAAETPAPDTAASPAVEEPAPAEAASAPAMPATPELPAAGLDIAATPPQVDAPAGSTLADQAADAAPPAEAPAAAPQEQAAIAPAPEPVATPEPPASPAAVRVDAVEIEGDKLFVAGSATPGHTVRVLADGVEVGTSKVDANGRFIVEAVASLAVGDHTISADLIAPGGGDVILRASVPFNRPEGETAAAVAEAETPEPAPAPASEAVPGNLVLPDIAAITTARDEAIAGLGELRAMMAPDAGVSPADLAARRSDLAARLEAIIAAPVPESAPAEARAQTEEMKATARGALAALNADGPFDPATLPDVATMQKMRDGVGAAVAALSADVAGGRAVTETSDPGAIAPAPAAPAPGAPAATAEAPVAKEASPAPVAPATAAATSGSEPATIQQAPLTPTAGSVIIRRGDTLWQISRRTYGQGVRYTTIYLANQQQIVNPDRISPGQVFSVPQDPLPDAEEMHRRLLEGRKQRRGN